MTEKGFFTSSRGISSPFMPVSFRIYSVRLPLTHFEKEVLNHLCILFCNSILVSGTSCKYFNTGTNIRGNHIWFPEIFSSIFLRCVLLLRVLLSTSLFPFVVSETEFSRSTLTNRNILSLLLSSKTSYSSGSRGVLHRFFYF